MSSATKALTLLSYFSPARPEIGLSQLCRLASRDKATTYRHLQALETAGFVEQNPLTKHYRLGPALIHLAQVREATVPREVSAAAPLAALANATGETAHITVLSGTTLYSLSDCESPRHSTRAVVDITTFPLHATASGLCALAFGPPELFAAALSDLTTFTPATTTTAADLKGVIAGLTPTGFGHADRSYQDDIHGIAAPLFDPAGNLTGTVAVACVASRFTDVLEQTVKSELITAAREITRNWGGTLPPKIEAAWAAFDTNRPVLEPTS